jgi:hypothetical protein
MQAHQRALVPQQERVSTKCSGLCCFEEGGGGATKRAADIAFTRYNTPPLFMPSFLPLLPSFSYLTHPNPLPLCLSNCVSVVLSVWRTLFPSLFLLLCVSVVWLVWRCRAAAWRCSSATSASSPGKKV